MAAPAIPDGSAPVGANATIGWGGELFIGNADGSAFVEILGVQSLPRGGGEVKRSDVDVTHMKSPDRIEETIKGLGKRGALTTKLLVEPRSEQDLFLRAAAADTGSRWVAIGIPANGVVVEHDVFLANIECNYDDLEPGKEQTATLSLTVAGPVETRAVA